MPSRTPDGWVPQDPSKLSQTAPWLAYVLPYAVFLLLTALEHQFAYVYPLFYTLKIAAVVWVITLVRTRLPELTQKPTGIGQGVIAGVILTVLWVAVDKVSPHFRFLGHRVGFNPTTLHPAAVEYAFVAVRLFGLAIVVPLVEETLYRAFLLRYSADPDRWATVPLGTVTLAGVGLNVAGMAVSHPEWLSAAVFAVALCFLVWRTKNLWACIVAHGVTNLGLGIYVLVTHDWRYW